jgi:hypothetical protein
MANWLQRYQLSVEDRLRRSIYQVLRDRLDSRLIRYALIDSYRNFRRAGGAYPYVQKKELKPRARTWAKEYLNQNLFLVLFCEGTIPDEYKKYVRFFNSNKVTKENIQQIAQTDIAEAYHKNLRYFDNPGFETMIEELLPIDYALLIQKDPTIKKRNRYVLSHFHVRIDWPIDDATEEMAKQLRYISKDLYERGEKYARQLHQKLFEKYGFHHSVGGRRTAAVVAAQLLQKMDFISTVYVSSAESRTLTRISEEGISKFLLMKLAIPEIADLEEKRPSFREQFLVDQHKYFGVGIFQVVYQPTGMSKAPEDKKLRTLDPDYQWLTVTDELLVPLPDHPEIYPVPYRTIYL